MNLTRGLHTLLHHCVALTGFWEQEKKEISDCVFILTRGLRHHRYHCIALRAFKELKNLNLLNPLNFLNLLNPLNLLNHLNPLNLLNPLNFLNPPNPLNFFHSQFFSFPLCKMKSLGVLRVFGVKNKNP